MFKEILDDYKATIEFKNYIKLNFKTILKQMKKIDENNIIIKENKDKDKRNLQFSKAIMIYLFSSSFIFEYLKKKIL